MRAATFARVALAMFIGACGSTPDLPMSPDASTVAPDAPIACIDQCQATDAGMDGPSPTTDAGAGLPIHTACDVLADQCASGLTCRAVGGTPPFLCEPVGPIGDGDICVSSEQCGHAMGCWSTPTGKRCLITCSTEEPLRRCAATQQCLPLNRFPYPAAAGICS
jgi:hypothetical protein